MADTKTNKKMLAELKDDLEDLLTSKEEGNRTALLSVSKRTPLSWDEPVATYTSNKTQGSGSWEDSHRLSG
ncbi:hypothetical protein TNCV_3051381 [Trichonephila clavipes]|nr:hypothetical protein TNCV_3051381 [Trichonephila clavipes]